MQRFHASSLNTLWEVLRNLFLMAGGSVLCVLAVNSILIPQQFFGAGFTGVALVLHYLMPNLPVAWIYFFLNIPVFALGWMYAGRRFFLYSIAGMLIFTAALAWIHFPLPVYDKILSALMAGILMGAGGGIILKSFGSAGGLDILSVIMNKRFSIRLGSTILGFNALILVSGAVLFSLEGALYTLIYIYVNASMVNLVVTGLSQRKAVFVISDQWERISKEITGRIQRGVTILNGQGGYTGRQVHVLYTVITMRELPLLKQLAKELDPNVFLVVSETMEVMGQRIGNQPHW
jgi:uncharacterized membrane-anchored protein YitT (DUF2179 family)